MYEHHYEPTEFHSIMIWSIYTAKAPKRDIFKFGVDVALTVPRWLSR